MDELAPTLSHRYITFNALTQYHPLSGSFIGLRRKKKKSFSYFVLIYSNMEEVGSVDGIHLNQNGLGMDPPLHLSVAGSIFEASDIGGLTVLANFH